MAHALIVDDDVNFQLGLAEGVRQEGFTVSTAGTLKEARGELEKNPPDVLFIDLNLPDGNGMELLQETEGPLETVMITGQASIETAVEALRRGVSDYLTKPVDFARVKMILANVTRTRELKQEIGTLRGELRRLGHFGSLIGASEPMQKVYDMIAKGAPTEATILLTGETGAGKEVVAQTIHSLSRGSFTGADRVHKGYFERANRVTLFLDEITEMPHELQVKLLRSLETATVQRVGGTEPLKINVRVIAATNRSPQEAVSAGKLRADLLYRLNVFPIHIPPLRERREDIEVLAKHFLGVFNKQEGTSKEFTPAALER